MWFGSRITAGEMFRYVEKLSQKSSEKNKAAASGSLRKKEKLYLPPKKPEEFSANWRSLQLIEVGFLDIVAINEISAGH